VLGPGRDCRSGQRVDDGALPTRPEVWDSGLHAEECPQAVDPPETLEVLCGFVFEGGPAQNAGVVHEPVQPAEPLHSALHGPLPRVGICDIEPAGVDGLGVDGGDVVDGVEYVSDDDPGARRHGQLADGPALPSCRSADEYHSSVPVHATLSG